MEKKELRNSKSKLKNNSKPSKLKPKGNFKVSAEKNPSPTRYGDWEKGGRCIDF